MVLSHFKREWGNESIYRRPFFYFRQISSPFEYQCGHEHGRTQRTSQPEIRGHPPWNATGNRGTVEQSSWCFRDICIYEPIFGREIWNVAIPFSSGHHSYLLGSRYWQGRQSQSLFHQVIIPTPVGRWEAARHSQVAIPFSSGHHSYGLKDLGTGKVQVAIPFSSGHHSYPGKKMLIHYWW